jgi:hypothetical protein
MPPPTTSMRSGMPSISSAPVESMTRGSSCGNPGMLHRAGAGGDDAVVEGQDTLPSRPSTPSGSAPRTGRCPGPPPPALLGHAGEATGELRDHLVLAGAHLVQVDLRRREGDAHGAHGLRLLDDRRGMQQRLRGDAADVEADPAEGLVALHQHHPQPQVRGAEGRRVAAGTAAEHGDLGVEMSGQRMEPADWLASKPGLLE